MLLSRNVSGNSVHVRISFLFCVALLLLLSSAGEVSARGRGRGGQRARKRVQEVLRNNVTESSGRRFDSSSGERQGKGNKRKVIC